MRRAPSPRRTATLRAQLGTRRDTTLSFVLGAGKSLPMAQYHLDQRPAALPKLIKTAHCKNRWAKQGRTNGMPWDGTSPITESTQIDAVKTKPRDDLGLGLWLARMGRL